MTQAKIMHKNGFACYDTEFELKRSNMYNIFETKFNNLVIDEEFMELFRAKYKSDLIPMFSLGVSIIKDNIEHITISANVAPFYNETLDLSALPKNIKTINFYSCPDSVTRNIPTMYMWPLNRFSKYIYWEKYESNNSTKHKAIELYQVVAIVKILHSSLDKDTYRNAIQFVDIFLFNIHKLENLVSPDIYRKILSHVASRDNS